LCRKKTALLEHGWHHFIYIMDDAIRKAPKAGRTPDEHHNPSLIPAERDND
jgi:hypothetical protein